MAVIYEWFFIDADDGDFDARDSLGELLDSLGVPLVKAIKMGDVGVQRRYYSRQLHQDMMCRAYVRQDGLDKMTDAWEADIKTPIRFIKAVEQEL